jgi:hypothetical protein
MSEPLENGRLAIVRRDRAVNRVSGLSRASRKPAAALAYLSVVPISLNTVLTCVPTSDGG